MSESKFERSIALNPWEWEKSPETPRPKAKAEPPMRRPELERLCLMLLRELGVPEELHESMMDAPSTWEVWRADNRWSQKDLKRAVGLWPYRVRVMGEFPS